jgi:hypothetical protein
MPQFFYELRYCFFDDSAFEYKILVLSQRNIFRLPLFDGEQFKEESGASIVSVEYCVLIFQKEKRASERDRESGIYRKEIRKMSRKIFLWRWDYLVFYLLFMFRAFRLRDSL